MKLRILSDIHCEFHPDKGKSFFNSLPELDEDIVIVAGDLSDSKSLIPALRNLCNRFKEKLILYTNGNHEAYSSSVDETEDRIKEFESDNEHENLEYLNNNVITVGPGVLEEGKPVYRFLGCTLWFPYQIGRVHEGEWAMNDFVYIKNIRNVVDQKNRESIKFLENNVTSNDIVITHHLPSYDSVHPKYTGSPLNKFFVGGAAHILQYHKPKLYIHGHSHCFRDYVDKSGSRVVCNPVGYPGEKDVGFNPNFTVEV